MTVEAPFLARDFRARALEKLLACSGPASAWPTLTELYLRLDLGNSPDPPKYERL